MNCIIYDAKNKSSFLYIKKKLQLDWLDDFLFVFLFPICYIFFRPKGVKIIGIQKTAGEHEISA